MSSARIPSKIVSLGGPKEAALYFDRIFPVDLATSTILSRGTPSDPKAMGELLSYHVPSIDSDEFPSVIASLLGADETARAEYLRQTILSASVIMASIAAVTRGNDHEKWDSEKFEEVAIQSAEKLSTNFLPSIKSVLRSGKINQKLINSLNSEITNAISTAGYDNQPTWQAANSFTLFSSPLLPSVRDDCFFASLSGLKIVDVTKTSWQNIVEFRKDPSAQAALRDLRLFFMTDLHGKDQSFIEDTLASRIYHHNEASRLWGFETINRTLGVLFSKESALPAIGGISAAILGAPLAAAAAGAAAFAIGSCAVELGRATIDRRKANLENPVRYLTNLEARLTSKASQVSRTAE